MMRYDGAATEAPRDSSAAPIRQAIALVVAALVTVNAFVVTFGMLLMFGLFGALGLVGGFATLPSPADLLTGSSAPVPTATRFVLPTPTPAGRAAVAPTPTPTPTRTAPPSSSNGGAADIARTLLRLWIFGSFFLALWPAGLAGYLTYSRLART